MLISETSSLIIQICGFKFMMCPLGLPWKAVKDIISMAGKVDESIQEEEKFKGSNFLRFRVAVDVSKLLCRGRKIVLGNAKGS